MKHFVFCFIFIFLLHLVIFSIIWSITLQNSKTHGPVQSFQVQFFPFQNSEYINSEYWEIRTRRPLYLNLFLRDHLNNCLCSFIASDYPSWMSGGFGKRGSKLMGTSIYFFYPMQNNHYAFLFRFCKIPLTRLAVFLFDRLTLKITILL